MPDDPTEQVAEALRAHQRAPDHRTTFGNSAACDCGWKGAGYIEHVAQAAIDALQLTEELPEPVMARFDRLPLPMQMRVAASVIDKVNRRAGDITSMPPLDHEWCSSSLHRWAEAWEAEDFAAAQVGPWVEGRSEQ